MSKYQTSHKMYTVSQKRYNSRLIITSEVHFCFILPQVCASTSVTQVVIPDTVVYSVEKW